MADLRSKNHFRTMGELDRDMEYNIRFYTLLECDRPLKSILPIQQIVKEREPRRMIQFWPPKAASRKTSKGAAGGVDAIEEPSGHA